MAFDAIKNYIKNKLTRFPKDIKYPIEEAFTMNGRTFYKYSDSFNVPYERGLKAVVFYEESRMKITYEYMQKHVEAVDKILGANKINVFKIKELNDILKERLTWHVDTEILYKLASIVYFEKSENPTTYDYKYNSEKIEFWKKHKTVEDFFLQAPLLELLPFLKDLEMNLKSYSEITEALNQIHSEKVSSIV